MERRPGHRYVPRGKIAAVFAALLCVAVALSWTLRPEEHQIMVKGLEEELAFTTTEQTLGRALAAQGIAISEADFVDPPLETSLRGEESLVVTIRRAVTVTLREGGEERVVASAATTVGELLAEAGVTLGELDRVSVPLETEPAGGMQIEVVRRTEQFVTVQEEIPYDTVTREDGSLPLGTTEVLQAGEPGRKEVTRRIILEEGQEVSSEVVEEVVLQEPRAEIIAYGTVGVVSRGGQDYRYTRVLEMIATGYTAGPESNPVGDGYTYTGIRAERGVVAVDPNVIPLYSRLYVEGYGPAIAADIGGAIKGNRIDLCFDTVAEALEWGVRPVTVYVLDE